MAQAHFSWQQPGSHQIMIAGKSMSLEKDSMTIREPKRQRLDPFGGPHPEGDPYVDQRGFMTRSIHAGASDLRPRLICRRRILDSVAQVVTPSS
jgi:hypothetical protein